MDKNGKSDPFVRFVCPDLFGKEQPKTKVCKKTLNPAWENKAVPTLRAMVDGGGIDVVRAMHLFLVLWDEDVGVRGGASNDLIGSAILHLDNYCNGGMVDFELDVREHPPRLLSAQRLTPRCSLFQVERNGTLQGKIGGRVQIRVSDAIESDV